MSNVGMAEMAASRGEKEHNPIMANLAIAYATLALAEQQRAANLLTLAAQSVFPDHAAAYVSEAISIIAPRSA